jgi:hypothetical protein
MRFKTRSEELGEHCLCNQKYPLLLTWCANRRVARPVPYIRYVVFRNFDAISLFLPCTMDPDDKYRQTSARHKLTRDVDRDFEAKSTSMDRYASDFGR